MITLKMLKMSKMKGGMMWFGNFYSGKKVSAFITGLA